MLLNTNATDEQTQSIYLGETAEPAGALITYTLQSSATSPMEGTDEPTGLAQVGPPAPGYYLPLETNYFVWLLPLASMTVMDIQLSSELSEPRNLVGHVVCPETSMPLRSVTVDALVDGDVAAACTSSAACRQGCTTSRLIPPGIMFLSLLLSSSRASAMG